VTLLPVWEQIRISVPPQNRYPLEDLGTLCWVPMCGERGERGYHHIVRRSFTGRPVDHIAIDGLVLDNRAKLCTWHHDDVTENRALIAYLTGEHWLWCTPVPAALAVGFQTTINPRTGTVYVVHGKLERKDVG